MSPKYASDTSVSTEASRGEIERTLQRYGATAFMYGWDHTQAVVQFSMNDRHIRFLLPMPDRNDKEFTHTPARGTRRTTEQAYVAWEQACRQRWRALALVVKAKLEAVDSGITSFESEFGMHIMLPDGSVAGDHVTTFIDQAYDTGLMPPILALGPAK